MANSLPHGLILAGMHSSSGKTAITCMVLAALQEQGICPQPFKVGPDFIDPGYHSQYTKRPCINLDAWMMEKAQILHQVQQHTAGTLGIVEGVMGLFDGASPFSDEGSTLELARWLDWPILLIVPCAKVGRSIAAAIRGFIEEAGTNRIGGLILNQVSGESHTSYLKDALSSLPLPILGAVSGNPLLQWSERHLGLQAQPEHPLPSISELSKLAHTVLDIPQICSLMAPAPEKLAHGVASSKPIRLGLAKDEAFHFYYHANLEYLRACGAELVEFSPLNDAALPPSIDGVIFGGGFPEIFVSHIADNATMRLSIGQAIQNGLPCYAECGGLMLLAEELITQNGQVYPMVGMLSGAVQMTTHLNHFGYCFCTALGSPILEQSNTKSLQNPLSQGGAVRGHEFHYSQWLAEGTDANLWQVTKKYRNKTRIEGFQSHHLHASYVHLYFPTASVIFKELFGLEQPFI